MKENESLCHSNAPTGHPQFSGRLDRHQRRQTTGSDLASPASIGPEDAFSGRLALIQTPRVLSTGRRRPEVSFSLCIVLYETSSAIPFSWKCRVPMERTSSQMKGSDITRICCFVFQQFCAENRHVHGWDCTRILWYRERIPEGSKKSAEAKIPQKTGCCGLPAHESRPTFGLNLGRYTPTNRYQRSSDLRIRVATR